jgi:hypothetical protein
MLCETMPGTFGLTRAGRVGRISSQLIEAGETDLAASMNKAELRELQELLVRLGELAEEDPQRSVSIGKDGKEVRRLTPEQAFTNLRVLTSQDGPAMTVMGNGSMPSRINPDFPWDGPEERVEIETDQDSWDRSIEDIRLLIENWDKGDRGD